MDLVRLFVTLGGLLLIGLTLWFFFGKRRSNRRPAPEGALYACPMHPWITSSDPGATCSLCGMKLVKGESQEG